MIRSLFNWLRRTLPPLWIVFVLVVFFAVFEGVLFWAQTYINEAKTAAEFAGQCLKIRGMAAAVIMGLYGLFRVAAFHPIFQPKYRLWLAQTPWTAKKPLPLGPIRLGCQDLIVLGVMLLFLRGWTLERIWVADAFLLVYVAALGYSFFRTGPWWMGYLIAFGLALAIRFALHPFIPLGILVVLYIVAMLGLRMALRRFPWGDPSRRELSFLPFVANPSPRQTPISVWPFSQLLDVPAGAKVNRRDGILAPLLAAWWIYAFTWNITKVEDKRGWPVVLALTALVVLLVRLGIYINSNWPPINVAGRFFSRHWIIPGYDCVYLAPLCILLTAFVGWVLAMLVGSPFESISYPLAMAAVLVVALNMGPSLRKWQLTGHHRIGCWNGGINEPNRMKL